MCFHPLMQQLQLLQHGEQLLMVLPHCCLQTLNTGRCPYCS
jgi:hypothetical protein